MENNKIMQCNRFTGYCRVWGVLLIILLIFLGCGNGHENNTTGIRDEGRVKNYGSFPKKVNKDVVLLSDSSIFSVPADIDLVDSTLIFRDAKGPPFIHAYRLRDGKIMSFGEEGQGPGEYMGVWRIGNINSSDKFRVFDLSQRRVSVCSKDSLFKFEGYKCRTEVSLKGEEGIPVRVEMGVDSTIIATGMYKKRIAFYSPDDGNLIKTIGDVPTKVDINGDISATQINRAYESNLSVDKVNSRVITAAVYADRIDIYELDGKLTTTVIGPSQFEPIMNVSPGGRVYPKKSTRTGYLDVDVGNGRLYALYSGLSEEESRADNKQGFKSIFVFDTSGNPIKRINVINHRLVGITPGPKGDKLFCSVVHPKPSVGYIELK